MNKKTAIFPGSFDPITIGHCNIIKRGLYIFDNIIIAIGNNTCKRNMFSLKQRKEWIYKTCLCMNILQKISIDIFTGMTIDFCKKKNIRFIIRGIRNNVDFEFEKNIIDINKKLYNECNIETVFLIADYTTTSISSYIVRSIIKNKGNYTVFVPKSVRI